LDPTQLKSRAKRRTIHDAVVVISGASSGIGRATALAFAAEDMRLVLASRSADALAEVQDACEARAAQVLVVPTDITDPVAVERLAAQAVQRFGRIDVWVEAAAGMLAGPPGSESVDEIRRLVDTNVVGSALSTRAALTIFQNQGHGVLIVVSSLLGVFPNPLAPYYSMTKFAIRGLALNLRQAVAGQRGVQVCLVMPGPVDTPLFQQAANHTGRRLRAIPPTYAPERLAATIVACARRPRRQATTGVVSRLALGAHRVWPGGIEWLVARWSANWLTQPVATPDTSGSLFDPQPEGRVDGGHRRGRLRRRLGGGIGASLAALHRR
jgi:NADP-dependent 3-hydroxy acid dehydrogenase YdfG